MNRAKILELLSLLNDKLKRDGIRGEIALYGGAVMCLCLNARGSTHDLDALFEPKSKIYQLAAEIAEEESIRKDWLNDAVKGFISTNDTMDLYDSLSNLDIYTTKYEYFFAMKCMSCRLNEDSSDEEGPMSQTMGFRKINIHLHKAASAIKNLFSEVYEPKLILYDFSREDTIDITGMNRESALNTYNVDYFWIELNNDFRISLFYKDFDASTGNIHVLPGILQIWKKDAETPEESWDEIRSEITPFRENEWSPLILQEFNFLWNFNLSEVETVLKKYLPLKVFLQDRPDNYENTCMSIDASPYFSKDFTLSSAQGNYKQFMHWKNHRKPSDGFFYTLHFTWKDKNGLWWTRYGDIQFWSHEVMQSNGSNTTHEWSKNEGWTLYYPVTNETPKFPPRTIDPQMNIFRDCQKQVDDRFEEYCDQVKSYDDIRFLINYLNIKDINEAENIILKYFPVNLLVPKTHFMLEEFFNK